MSEQNEPSMEDILSSIRKILSDDIEDVPAEQPEEVQEVMEEPAPEPEFVPEPVMEQEEDVVSLTPDMVIEESQLYTPPPPPPQPKPQKIPETFMKSTEELISKPVQDFAVCKFAELAKAMAEEKVAFLGNGKITIEQLIKELLRPMLKEWLDANLQDVVERMVEKEIQRVGEKIKLF